MKIENLGNLLGLLKGAPSSGEDLPQGFLDLLFLLFKGGKERLPLEEGFSPLSEGNSPFKGDLKQRTFFLEDKSSEGLKDPLPNTSEENSPFFVPQEALWAELAGRKEAFKEAPKQGTPLLETTSKTQQDTKASLEKLSEENSQEEVADEVLRLLAPFYAGQNNLSPTKNDFPARLEKIFSAPLASRAPLSSPPNLKGEDFSPAPVKEKPELVPEEAFISEAQDEPDLGPKDTSHFTRLKIDSSSPKDVQTPPVAKDLFQEKAKINSAEKGDPSPPREKEGFQPDLLDHSVETSSFHPQDRLHPKENHEMAPAPKSSKEEKFEDLSPDPPVEHLGRKEPVHHQPKEPSSPPPKVSPAELPEFVKEIVVKTHPEGKHEARLKLHPPELGEIHLSVSVDRGEVKLLLTVEHPRAAEAIQQHLHQLEVSLQELGLQLGGAEINLAGGGGQDHAPERNEINLPSRSLTKEVEGVEEIRSTPKRNGLIDLRV